MENDSELVTGMTSIEMFSNEEPTEDKTTALAEERELISKMLPSAQAQVDALNKEIANANQLSDFISCLKAALPTDIPDDKLSAKLESRFAYINYLLRRKSEIIAGMASIGHTIDDVKAMPVPVLDQVKIHVAQQVVVTNECARGWKAIWLGIRDIFGVSPM